MAIYVHSQIPSFHDSYISRLVGVFCSNHSVAQCNLKRYKTWQGELVVDEASLVPLTLGLASQRKRGDVVP